MIRQEEVYRIGRLGKAHGVKGEVSFMFDDDVFDRVDADYLVLRIDGIFVPFFIEEYHFRSDSTALVKFEGIDTQERARELTNVDVYFPRHLAPADDDDLQWSFFVGFTVTDATTQRTVGTIESVDDATINVLFELADGTLIPAAEELMTAIDYETRTITMALPEGLI